MFFALSGRVIASKILASKSADSLVSSSVRRPFRLLIPVLGSLLFLWLCTATGVFDESIPQRVYNNSNGAIAVWDNSPPNITFITCFTSTLHMALAEEPPNLYNGATWYDGCNPSPYFFHTYSYQKTGPCHKNSILLIIFFISLSSRPYFQALAKSLFT